MTTIKTFILLLVLSFISSQSFANQSLSFPNETQRKDIAVTLLSAIESIDAMTIELRNNTRKIDWQTFKTINTNNITKAADWDSLYRAINNIHFGIINRHSYVLVEKSIRDNIGKLGRWPGFEIGYTWPEISFFSLDNQQQIDTINNKSITELFDTFFNLYCNDVHTSGCLRLFSDYMKSGYYFLGNSDELKIAYKNGTQDTINKTVKAKSEQKSNEREAIDCSNVYSSVQAELRYNGSQSCLFETQSAYILKILYFGSWGTNDDDIYCEHAKEKGMCADINEIKRLTNAKPSKSLVIDIQNNGGGAENTPWIAALTQHGFKDNLVLYKNLPLLADPTIRQGAFYGSEYAENWYQKIKDTVKSSDLFLPKRSDFCRGSTFCEAKTVNSASTSINYLDLKLITNEKCVSSCDDFIWRLRQYAQGKTYGQLPATDGAYARLNGYLFMTKDGAIKNIIAAEGNAPSIENAALLVSYRIPISKTVTLEGKNLEGDDSVLDFPLSISQDNFSHIAEENLKRVLAM